MTGTLFRYYSERDYAERFLDGKLLFRSLSFYRDIEDQEVRGDPNEGRLSFSPAGGLEITKENGVGVRSFTHFNSAVREDEIFVFCLSDASGERKSQKFGRIHCEISDSAIFIERVIAALPPGATFFAKKVTYDDPRDPPGARWACPELITASKWPAFSWQDEFRLLFSVTNALAFENCHMTVSNSLPARPPRQTALPSPIKIQIATGLRDIAVLHTN